MAGFTMAVGFKKEARTHRRPSVEWETPAWSHQAAWAEPNGEDDEFPRRAAIYLVSRGFSQDEAARAIEAEFELPAAVAAGYVIAA